MRYLEMRLGPSQGLSGQESSVDPSAPATKTLALMRQVKGLLDPKGILNPHKLFPSGSLADDKSGFLATLPTLRDATPG